MAIHLVVPELGESVVEATVLRWSKQEGERVTAGELLVELETEKVNLDVTAPTTGMLAHIVRKVGEDVKIGDVLGEIEPVAAGESAPPVQAPKPQAQTKSETANVVQAVTAAQPAAAEPGKPEIKVTPVAQRLANESGIDIQQVPAGANQRVTKQDVANYLQKQKAPAPKAASVTAPREPSVPAPSPGSNGARNQERVRMSRRRQTIARRLLEAQQTAAMLTTFNEADMTAVMEIRRKHKESFKQKYGVSLGLTSFFVKAAIGALEEFPLVNAEIQGDEIVYKRYFDIGVAVGAAEGLVVPVLQDADKMSFQQIESKIGEFAQKAQAGTLSLNDLRGGTFTITNGGVFGSLLSTPILNPPQVGILGLHKIQERPVALNGQVVIRPMMYLALSYDHRLVDGREAVQFLVRVKGLIEDPGALLLEG